ncbi:MAG: hypothetical protein ACI9WU_000403 [Myxococcota bacterium]|jgi:hypothetical protein
MGDIAMKNRINRLARFLTCAVVCAGLSASAAEAPQTNEIKLPLSEQRLVQLQKVSIMHQDTGVIYESAVGEWTRPDYLDRLLPSTTMQLSDTVVATKFGQLTLNSGYFGTRDVALRINGLDTVGRELVPDLAEENGVDEMNFSDDKLGGGTWSCYDWTFHVRDVGIKLPVDSSTVSGSFGDSGRTVTDWSLNTACATARFDFEAERKNNKIWCLWALPINIELSINIEDLDGEVDFTAAAGSDNTVTVTSIDKMTLELSNIGYQSNSGFLNAVLAVGFSLYDLFKTSCSGIDDCASEVVNDILQSKNKVEERLLSTMDDALAQPLAMGGGTSTEGLSIEYSVALDGLQSSKNHDTMTTLWDVDLGNGGTTDTCASGLTLAMSMATGSVGHASYTSDDLEVELPYSLIARAAWVAGQQGVFCHSFEATEAGGSGLGATGTVVPSGSIRATAGSGSDPANTVILTLPVRATLDGATSGDISADVTVKAEFETSCGEGLYAVITDVSVANFSGTITLSGFEIDAADMEDFLVDLIEDEIPASLPSFQVLPQVTALNDSGSLSLSVGEVVSDTQVIVVGLNFGGSNCSSGGSGGGSGGTTGGGGGKTLPGDLEIINPWDDDDDAEGGVGDDLSGAGGAETMGSGI